MLQPALGFLPSSLWGFVIYKRYDYIIVSMNFDYLGGDLSL